MIQKSRAFYRFKTLFLLFSILAVFVVFDIYISYNSLKTTEYIVRSDKITESVSICLLADLHDHRFGEENKDLVSRVRECQPDLILLAGDFINKESAGTSVPAELIPQLTEIAPVYYSLGNQEKDYMAAGTSDLIDELTEAGASVLEEEYINLTVKGNKICLAGMYEYAFAQDGRGHMNKDSMDPDRRQFLETFQKQEGFKIMMAHRPDSFIFAEAADIWEIDLVLSGHLHGGQVVLPFLGGLYAGDQGFFPEYDYGVFHFEAVKAMIISSGLGSDREKLPRFNNRPEVALITLERE